MRGRASRASGGEAQLCKDVRELGGGRYGATLRTRLGSHELVLADERGVARLVDFK
jgi:hypothetical protein